MAINLGSFGLRGGGSANPYAPRDYTPAYGGIPNLPPYITDTTTMLGTDRQAEMIRNLPGYQAMVGADVGNIQSNLAGRLAPDVIQLLQQQAAERGIGTGAGVGSPNTDAAYLRALGLTSLQLQQMGHQQLTEAMARTPFQEKQVQTAQKDLGMERAQYAAAPNPYAQAMEALRVAKEGTTEGKSQTSPYKTGNWGPQGVVGYYLPGGMKHYY